MKDVYSSLPFNESTFHAYGTLTNDHFIPWGFVLHDEAWDLAPMFRNENSSKSDKLPKLEKYFDSFCAQHFNAIMTIKEAELVSRHRKQFDSYRTIAPELDQYTRSDANRGSFYKRMKDTIYPLYQIALNQGFSVWECV